MPFNCNDSSVLQNVLGHFLRLHATEWLIFCEVGTWAKHWFLEDHNHDGDGDIVTWSCCPGATMKIRSEYMEGPQGEGTRIRSCSFNMSRPVVPMISVMFPFTSQCLVGDSDTLQIDESRLDLMERGCMS